MSNYPFGGYRFPTPNDPPEERPSRLQPDEYTKVLEWRAECLVRVGVEDTLAAALAISKHDLRIMEDSFRGGMTPAQAEAIFL